MVLVLIDTLTGQRRTILVPIRMDAEPGTSATILTHPLFARRG